jgi:hypothetical protein
LNSNSEGLDNQKKDFNSGLEYHIFL